jgi:molecular chaperone GrpE (heat shock protein)
MLRKSIILGLVLFLVGTAALSWVLVEKRKEQQEAVSYKSKHTSELDVYLKQYNEWLHSAPENRAELPWGLDKYGKTKSVAQLRLEQQERLKADLDRLATGETDAYPFADILYGENWREELDKYKTRKEKRELVLTGSILCMLTGGLVFSGWLLLWTTRLVIKVFYNWKKFFAANWSSLQIKTKAKHVKKKVTKTSEQEHKLYKPETQSEKQPAGLRELEWNNFEGLPKQNKVGFETASAKNAEMSPKVSRSTLGTQKVAVSRSGENYVKSKEPLKTATEGLDLKTTQISRSAQSVCEPTQPVSQEGTVGNSLELEDSLKVQTENLEKQMAEFKQVAQTVQQTALEHSGPLNSTLKDLNQQVAAIREYASQQQDRVEKLQDGYDWNIVRTFCLRVIRCIDNLENRIKQLSKEDVETINLEEVKDELLFALESSGVEQFEPEINTDYRGQEKSAEVVKEKEGSDDPKMAGKIAKVIRPGYQYVIDDENIKVVRTARVKLFR